MLLAIAADIRTTYPTTTNAFPMGHALSYLLELMLMIFIPGTSSVALLAGDDGWMVSKYTAPNSVSTPPHTLHSVSNETA
jgi:hypothetical protein